MTSSNSAGELPALDDWSNANSPAGTRLEDGRTLTWQEYGNHRGLPILLIPDSGSSRLAPNWLLHDAAMPNSLRLICFDRPGSGGSDPVAVDTELDTLVADDLARVVRTLAVGRVVVIGVGLGASAALAFAQHKPELVLESIVVEPDLSERTQQARAPWARLLGRAGPSTPVAKRWAEACRGPITALQSWERGLSRLSPEDRAALGERYLDASFRQHLADDLAEGDRPLVNLLPPTWMHEWSSPVPVTCWAAAGEQAIADIAAVRAGWTLVSSDAQPPFLADWEQILSRAAQAYRTGGTVLPGVAY